MASKKTPSSTTTVPPAALISPGFAQVLNHLVEGLFQVGILITANLIVRAALEDPLESAAETDDRFAGISDLGRED